LQTDNKTVDNQSRLWRQSLGIGELTLAAKDELHRLIDTWASAKAGANEQRAIGEELTQQYNRAQSRAERVIKTSNQHINAINKGTATDRQGKNRDRYSKHLAEASEHLNGLKIVMALEIATAKACKERFQQLDEEANALEVEIAQRLKSGIRRALAVRCVGEDARNKGKESQANALLKTVGKGAVSITGAPGTASSKGYVPAAVSTGTQEASPKPIMRRIDEVVRAVTPIIESEHPAGPIYKLDEAAMKLHAIDARELSALNVQMRLAGGYREQQREIGRLVGYAHAFPARMTVIAPSPTGTLFTGVRLPRNAPPELQSLANKYAHHQPAQQQLADAIYERNRKSSEDGLSAHSPPQRPIAAPRMMGKVAHAGPIMNGRSVLAATFVERTCTRTGRSRTQVGSFGK